MVPGGPEDLGLEGQDGSSPHGAFTVLSRGPVPPTQASRHRESRKRGERQTSGDQATRELLLKAYPPLHSKESEESRLARARWCEETWKRVEGAIQESMDAADRAVFSSLAKFASLQHHSSSGASASARAKKWNGKGERIPTALVLAGSIASSEQSATFPKMAAHLRDAGCPVALLRDVHFSTSKPETQLSTAFNTILRQLSNLEDSEASDVEALTSWYEDFATESGSPSQQPPPPIVIIESIEATPLLALQDMVSIFYENWSRFPLVLILGTRTCASAPTSLLPADLITRALNCHHFSLATAVARLEGLVQNAILRTREFLGILFHPHIVSSLWDSFLLHHFSPSIIVQGLRLAVLAHSKSTRLEHIQAAETSSAVRHAWLQWSAAIHCTVETACAVGIEPQHNRLTYWQLYRDAGNASFITTRGAQDAIARLKAAILQMDSSGTVKLIERLKEILSTCISAEDRAPDNSLVQAIAILDDIEKGTAVSVLDEEQAENDTAEISASAATRRSLIEVTGNGDGDGDGTGAQLRAKRVKKYHSRSSRRVAMLGIARQGENAGPGTGIPCTATAAPVNTTHPQPMSSRLATWLSSWLLDSLGTSPMSMSQASGITCKEITALDCLTAAPRDAIHTALSRPLLFYPSSAISKSKSQPQIQMETVPSLGIKVAPGVEDACIAYRLFDENPSCSNIAEWYCAFKDVCVNAVPKNRQQSPSIPEEQLVARFCQAAAELQYIGLLKPANKAEKEVVLRAVHMPAPVLSLPS